jgi:hypothetical protein
MHRERVAFVLRIWLERDAPNNAAWRGSLQRVDEERVHYFAAPEEIPALVRRVFAKLDSRSEHTAIEPGFSQGGKHDAE